MPRNYVRPLGARKYTVHTEETLKSAFKDLVDGSSYREVASKYGIAVGTLRNKVCGLHDGQVGRSTRLTTLDEEVLVQNILTAVGFGFPFEKRDLQWITTSYLKSIGKVVPVFKNNVPGSAWLEYFLRRHASTLSGCLRQNSGRNTATETQDAIKEYFRKVKEATEGVPPSNIISYDETNLTDNPNRKKGVFKRDKKYPQRIMNEAKAAVSLMVAGSADGKLFSPYVCYKAERLLTKWKTGGPMRTKYNSSKSGWLEGYNFEDWFVSCLLPQIEHLPGKKVIIADQLSTHFNDRILQLCKTENVTFVCLPPNCTHILQPLDVCFFAPMKKGWRRILKDYTLSNPSERSIQKNVFPSLLKELWTDLKRVGSSNLRSAFETCLDEEKCLGKILPSETVA